MIRKVERQSCGKTRSMSTSQAREINNTKELTIFRLQNVSRRECWTFVYSVGTSPLISILLRWIHISYVPLIWLMVCVRNSRLRSRYGAQGRKISLMLMIETPPFWPYSYIFLRVVYRNTRHMSTILVTNIMQSVRPFSYISLFSIIVADVSSQFSTSQLYEI